MRQRRELGVVAVLHSTHATRVETARVSSLYTDSTWTALPCGLPFLRPSFGSSLLELCLQSPQGWPVVFQGHVNTVRAVLLFCFGLCPQVTVAELGIEIHWTFTEILVHQQYPAYSLCSVSLIVHCPFSLNVLQGAKTIWGNSQMTILVPWSNAFPYN